MDRHGRLHLYSWDFMDFMGIFRSQWFYHRGARQLRHSSASCACAVGGPVCPQARRRLIAEMGDVCVCVCVSMVNRSKSTELSRDMARKEQIMTNLIWSDLLLQSSPITSWICNMGKMKPTNSGCCSFSQSFKIMGMNRLWMVALVVLFSFTCPNDLDVQFISW